ncbi:RimK family alpha-L-glutamate ligase [Streptomyces sp. SPB162]|uniref:RimK family alpha-L-glutamate ligase n=1 Tax=Streptomyces sp. SPB162 TaxID=2940560 RepID=UPI0024066EF5|nr:RimK family alpha-L-glutamate ligase [Streptomyces sp. SPB162]MDF9815308.1 [lysine-biosynthesis-protein LysW]--L-2-aminoadipate ligase [Streptomyces sp. SPB162]
MNAPEVSADLPPRLAVIASRVAVEEKRILEELDRRRVPYDILDPRTAVFRLDRPAVRWSTAVAREVSHHRSLTTARVLEHAGVRVVNSAAAIALCGDKLLTTLALRAAGLPVPRCLVAFTPEAAIDALDDFGYPAVVKPLTGSGGRQVARLAGRDAAEAVLELREALPGPQQRILYLQEYIDKPGRDIRGLVFGSEVVGAVYRTSLSWRTNTARDAGTEPCPLTAELEKLLADTAAAIGPGVYGIDVLEDAEGRLLVNEVNHTPQFRGAAAALGMNLAGHYVDYLVEQLVRN